jgi:hypothetical protein
MKNRSAGSPHAWDEERAARVAEAMKHPDAEDFAVASERFRAAVGKLRDESGRQ